MKPDLDAIRARLWSASTRPYTFAADVSALLRHIDALEHMLGEERENVDALRARVAELEAHIVTLEAMKP